MREYTVITRGGSGSLCMTSLRAKPLLSRRTGRRSLPFAASAAGAGSPSGGNYCAARRLLVLVRRGFLSVENARGSVVFSGLRLFPAFLRAARFYGSASSRFRVEKVFPVPECGTGKRMVCPCLEDYFVMASNILPSSSGVTDLLETFTRGVTASTIFFS